ncbi:HAMP domain-containing histidine kinase [Hymenobacter sp. 15J16-1T3B]|uniref:sensor histidine kinase n=1 Tax=Hymenobacter sp. 15J16-1T3B TaxID=2886941 RepID=UPI001D117D05|nr:HAMP domain-containing sensor histidine kinase [Hymenobacter sp. 15J16-1T3B]MCC3157354.1 HAMP domain-containing histidine kinase [Hymenobacter sp. 15J16-1T3B]
MTKRFLPLALLLLALLCFLGAYLSNHAAAPGMLVRADVARLQQQLTAAERRAEQDAETLAVQLLRGQGSFATLQAAAYPTFVFRDGQLLYWSENTMRPDVANVSQPFGDKLVEMRFGSYLAIRRPAGPFVILSYVPLRRQYGIINRYLREGGRVLFKGLDVSLVPNAQQDRSLPALFAHDGHYLFSLRSLQPDPITGKYLPLALLLLGTACYVAAWLTLAGQLFRRRQPWAGAAAVVLPLAFFRAVLLHFNLPFAFIELPLFDPKLYAASWVSPSLGDLLINALLLLIIAWYALLLFRRYGVARYVRRVPGSTGQAVVAAVACLCFFGGLLMLYSFYLSSVSNSQLVLDVTQSIQFSGFKLLLCLAVVLHTGSYFIGFWLLTQLYLAAVPAEPQPVRLLILGAATLLVLPVGLALGETTVVLLGLTLLFFLVLRVASLRRLAGVLPFRVVVFLFLMLGLSASVGSLALYQHFKEQLIQNKQRLAGNLLVDNDLQGEFLLAQRAHDIAADGAVRTRLANRFANQDVVRQKIAKYYLRGYFNKYEVRVSLFDGQGQPLNEADGVLSLAATRAQVLRQATPTDLPDLYLVHGSTFFDSRRYVAFVPVPTVAGTQATVLLELTLKKLTANSVVPELLVDQNYFQPGLGNELSYAGYEKGRLVYSEGDFDYVNELPATALRDPRLYADGLVLNGAHHFGVKGPQQRTVVVSTPTYAGAEWLANFSFWFLLHLIGGGLVALILLALRNPRRRWFRTTFSAKIQLFMTVGILATLLVVSLATASLFTDSYKRDLRRSYERRGQLAQASILRQRSLLADSTSRGRLGLLADNVSALTETDLNIYDARGELLVSSQQLIFEAGLISTLMNPEAVVALAERGQPRILLTERAGSLLFNTLYLPIRAQSASPGGGAVLGYVGIPFLDSQKDLNTKLTELTTTILNIFTVMFIGFLLLTFVATRVLTRPLKLITEKLRHTTLTGNNEPLAYESNDELGLLVREYNTMLHKLEDSKQELAMQEKEAAWREMARQVAHEIKNPLTPMKLSLQFLQRALTEKRGNLEEMIGRISQTLITQIDVLTDIATSFSNFTNLPAMRPERLVIAQVLRRCVALHQHVQLEVGPGAEEANVFADENLLVRTFNNLLLNALQAIPKDRPADVHARVELPAPGTVRISIQDNGSGIEEDVRDKVFRPNFTTKETGSGIGLAVAKRGIESAGGKVWFETVVGEGTTFFIELPQAPG